MFCSVRSARIGTASPSASRAAPSASLSAAAIFAGAVSCGHGAGLGGVHGHGAHTFSTSGLPSSPEGMKISVIARIEKVATSL